MAALSALLIWSIVDPTSKRFASGSLGDPLIGLVSVAINSKLLPLVGKL